MAVILETYQSSSQTWEVSKTFEHIRGYHVLNNQAGRRHSQIVVGVNKKDAFGIINEVFPNATIRTKPDDIDEYVQYNPNEARKHRIDRQNQFTRPIRYKESFLDKAKLIRFKFV